MTSFESDSYADRQYEAQLRRHLLNEEKRRRISSGEDISVTALQQWALANVYDTELRNAPISQ